MLALTQDIHKINPMAMVKVTLAEDLCLIIPCYTCRSTLSLTSLPSSISCATVGGDGMVMLGAGGLPNSRVMEVLFELVMARRLLLNL